MHTIRSMVKYRHLKMMTDMRMNLDATRETMISAIPVPKQSTLEGIPACSQQSKNSSLIRSSKKFAVIR